MDAVIRTRGRLRSRNRFGRLPGQSPTGEAVGVAAGVAAPSFVVLMVGVHVATPANHQEQVSSPEVGSCVDDSDREVSVYTDQITAPRMISRIPPPITEQYTAAQRPRPGTGPR